MNDKKEAQARIKINEALKKAGWRFFDDENGKANIRLEANVKITQKDMDDLGIDFKKTKQGFVDFLLLDDDGGPFVVVEAKSEDKNPLDGKEQARKYADEYRCPFVILSNGNTHYLWNLQKGNPEIISAFPTLESLKNFQNPMPPKDLSQEPLQPDFIALSQNPKLKDDPLYQNEKTRDSYIRENNLRILRGYQMDALYALQKAAALGKKRFLFEMATGTGKTLVSAAIAKLFLRTKNAKRVLFLVDRLELENQAFKDFKSCLQKDYLPVIYKENRDDWRKADIVISTIQSLSADDKYKTLFSPDDFGLLIADESHRAISGISRDVFEYFNGYKLGLTATPKDYLKNIDLEKLSQEDPRALEKRQLLDTYKTFHCQNSEPTYRFSLIDGVKSGFLINPITVDARTEITTQLLSEQGFVVNVQDENGLEKDERFVHTDFEKSFFSDNTNRVFCETFIEHALKDPISCEIGKTIVFCVSQNHASKIAACLNKIADAEFPDKYKSDFAVQVTSNIADAQRFAVNFANNNLNGSSKFLEGYKTSKTRVCVTVGMMTTGYDCRDILNIVLMRPIFSPTDFVQIKGRGTRKYDFEYEYENRFKRREPKERFKLFDFFANCQYFETEFNYDQPIEIHLDIPSGGGEGGKAPKPLPYDNPNPDKIDTINENPIGPEGMRIDRELFETIKNDSDVKDAVEKDDWEAAEQIMRDKYDDKPQLFITLEKIRRIENLDINPTWREFLERVFGITQRFMTKDELLEKECEAFIDKYKPKDEYVALIKDYMKAYIGSKKFRQSLDEGFYPKDFHGFEFDNYKKLGDWGKKAADFVKNNVDIKRYET
jgi:type I restriction enzyme R subunit